MHSTWSDGKNTIAEMAAACVKRGHKYIVITDHSRSLGIANGSPSSVCWRKRRKCAA